MLNVGQDVRFQIAENVRCKLYWKQKARKLKRTSFPYTSGIFLWECTFKTEKIKLAVGKCCTSRQGILSYFWKLFCYIFSCVASLFKFPVEIWAHVWAQLIEKQKQTEIRQFSIKICLSVAER